MAGGDARIGIAIVGGLAVLVATLGIVNIFTETDLFAEGTREERGIDTTADRRAFSRAIEKDMDELGFSVDASVEGRDRRRLRVTSPHCSDDAVSVMIERYGKGMRMRGFDTLVCDTGSRNWRREL